MTQVFPKNDTFAEGTTTYGTYLVGYSRLVPWTTDAGSGDSIAQSVGNLHSGYFTQPIVFGGVTIESVNGTSRKAAVRNTGASGAVSCFAWRQLYVANAEARLGFNWKAVGATPAPVTSFRYAMVGVRIAGQGEDTTAGQERLTLGDGYWLVFRNTTSQPGAKFYLLRVNAGTTTKLAESSVVDISTLRVTAGLWLSLRATGTGGTVTLRCRRGPIGREAVDGSSTVDVFGADVLDTSGSRLTAAGRTGFGMAKPEAGGIALSSFFEATDVDGGAVSLRDEWDRSNYLVGSANASDVNGKTGRYLMPWYAASVGGVGNLAHRDAGLNRVKNAPSGNGLYTLDFVSAIRATHEAVQRRAIDGVWATSAGRTDQVWIELRGKDLHAPTAATAQFYRAEMESVAGTSWTFRLYSIIGGVSTLLATKTAALANGTHVFDFDVQNVGGFTPLDGDPNLVVRLGGSGLTGWTLAGVLGVEQLSNGTVVDRRSVAIRRGWEQGWRFRSSPQSGSPTFSFDNWLDNSTPTDPPIDSLANQPVSTEVDGATGTLTAAHSWKVEERHVRPSVLHEFESDHKQRVSTGSRDRRVWSCHMPAAKQTEVDTLDSFWTSHKGCEVPFTWSIDGEAVTGRFVKDSKDVALIGRSLAGPVYRYAFEVEELFA